MATQTFLPIITPDNRVLGIVPISSTDFVGTEPDFTIVGGTYPGTYPLRRVQYQSLSGNRTQDKATNVDYMAISLSLSEERRGSPFVNMGYITSQVSAQERDTRAWRNAPNHSVKTRYTGTLVAFILKGTAISAPAPVPSGGNGSNASMPWSVNSPFTNVAQSEFIDINWQQVLGVDTSPYSPASVSIGTPSADPGSGNMLRAYVVQQGLQVVNDMATYSTIRVIKVFPGQITAGTYTWPLTVTRTDGSTVTLNFSIVAS